MYPVVKIAAIEVSAVSAASCPANETDGNGIDAGVASGNAVRAEAGASKSNPARSNSGGLGLSTLRRVFSLRFAKKESQRRLTYQSDGTRHWRG
jgi:hypothetical protein